MRIFSASGKAGSLCYEAATPLALLNVQRVLSATGTGQQWTELVLCAISRSTTPALHTTSHQHLTSRFTPLPSDVDPTAHQGNLLVHPGVSTGNRSSSPPSWSTQLFPRATAHQALLVLPPPLIHCLYNMQGLTSSGPHCFTKRITRSPYLSVGLQLIYH